MLDFGSQAAGNMRTHREALDGYDVTYTGVDVATGENVDLVMRKPYRIPARSNSFDLVITGSAFEHIPFMWASFLEISRVLRPGGLIFLTAPSRGHIHFDVDCWRFYPDSMRALAAFARMTLLEAHTDLPPKEASGSGRRTTPRSASTRATGATPSGCSASRSAPRGWCG